MQDLKQLVGVLGEAATARQISSVMRPLIALLIVGMILAVLATFTPFWLSVVFAGLVAVIVLAFIGFYGFFALRNPDALRTESYVLKKRGLDLIDAKDFAVPVPANSLEVLTNPDGAPALPSQKRQLLEARGTVEATGEASEPEGESP